MSKKIVLLGDLGSDHQGFPPTPVIAGSADVLVDGKQFPVAVSLLAVAALLLAIHIHRPRFLAFHPRKQKLPSWRKYLVLMHLAAALPKQQAPAICIVVRLMRPQVERQYLISLALSLWRMSGKLPWSLASQEEADLMDVAAQVNARVRSLEQDEAQFIVKHYDLLEAVTSTGSAGLGAGAVMVSKQISTIETTLKEIERLHQDSYGKHGHLNNPEFFEKRRTLFKKLDFSLGSVARKGMSLDDDVKLKRALGLSSKGIVSHWKKAGIGSIPGYATNYERIASGAKYVKGAGYLSIGLDVAASGIKIHEVCKNGRVSECRRVKYIEGGRLSGSALGGGVGAFSGPLMCGVIGIGSAGIGGIACGIIMAGIGGYAGGSIGGNTGENIGEVIYEVTNDE